jgi:hypothetical protein
MDYGPCLTAASSFGKQAIRILADFVRIVLEAHLDERKAIEDARKGQEERWISGKKPEPNVAMIER